MHIMPEVSLQRVIETGIVNLRGCTTAFNEIFALYTGTEMKDSYGQSYVDDIRTWFGDTVVPVTQAWAYDPTRVPSIAVSLSDDSEDESKAAMNDHYGMGDDDALIVGVMNVSLDIAIHADRSKDHVLWLYYIISYILYKEKRLAENLGLQLHTFRAGSYNRNTQKMPEHVFTRYISFRCTVQNVLAGIPLITPDKLIVETSFECIEGDETVPGGIVIIEQ